MIKKYSIILTFVLVFIVAFGILTFAGNVLAATLYEYYNTGDDAYTTTIKTNFWAAQSFTPSTTHYISYVKLKCFRNTYVLGDPGNLIIDIYATDGAGKPTGASLSSGYTNANIFTLDTGGAWYQINMSAYELIATTKYAIVLHLPSGDVGAWIKWRLDGSAPAYADGAWLWSNDTGATWNEDVNYDGMFEEWGTIGAPSTPSTSGNELLNNTIGLIIAIGVCLTTFGFFLSFSPVAIMFVIIEGLITYFLATSLLELV